MEDGFLKPPSATMWLLLVVCSLALGSGIFGDVSLVLAVIAILVGEVVALSVVLRWLGRVIGYAAGEMLQGFATGYREARENARERTLS